MHLEQSQLTKKMLAGQLLFSESHSFESVFPCFIPKPPPGGFVFFRDPPSMRPPRWKSGNVLSHFRQLPDANLPHLAPGREAGKIIYRVVNRLC